MSAIQEVFIKVHSIVSIAKHEKTGQVKQSRDVQSASNRESLNTGKHFPQL